MTAKAFCWGWYFGTFGPQQLPHIGAFGPAILGADIFGAFIFGGLMLGGLIFGLQQPLHPIHPMHDNPPQHPTFGPSNLGADILGAFILRSGLMTGPFNFGLQHELHPMHDNPAQHASLGMHDIPEQHPAFGTFGPDNLGADILGALSLGGLIDGAFNFGLQHLLVPQQAQEATQFYQHPTFFASFGPSILGAILFSGLIAISSFLAPFGSTRAASPIIICWSIS